MFLTFAAVPGAPLPEARSARLVFCTLASVSEIQVAIAVESSGSQVRPWMMSNREPMTPGTKTMGTVSDETVSQVLVSS